MAGGMLLAVVTGQVLFFKKNFESYILKDYAQSPLLNAAQIVRHQTPSGSSILVFGDDWSSAVPYYAERKALAIPEWAPPALIDRVIADPQSFLGNRPLGAIVLCRDRLLAYKDRAGAIERFAVGRAVIGEFGGCKVLANQN
jgi:hypothetical protein